MNFRQITYLILSLFAVTLAVRAAALPGVTALVPTKTQVELNEEFTVKVTVRNAGDSAGNFQGDWEIKTPPQDNQASARGHQVRAAELDREFIAHIARTAKSGAPVDWAEVSNRHSSLELLATTPDEWIVTVSGEGLETLAKASLRLSSIVETGEAVSGAAQAAEGQIGRLSMPRLAIASANDPERDSDGDTLTDTEERWWGTNPFLADTDGDGVNDGEEISQARAGDHSAGIPWPDWPKWGERPNRNIGWGWGDDTEEPIVDLDMDCIPDKAEQFVLGLNRYNESTDHDRYDDGQEFWGVTQFGRGALPRAVDSDFLLGEMPGFVDSPGNSAFVTAYPKITFRVVDETLKIVRREKLTSENREITENEFNYVTEQRTVNSETSSTDVTVRQLNTILAPSVSQPPPPPQQIQVAVSVNNPVGPPLPQEPDSDVLTYSDVQVIGDNIGIGVDTGKSLLRVGIGAGVALIGGGPCELIGGLKDLATVEEKKAEALDTNIGFLRKLVGQIPLGELKTVRDSTFNIVGGALSDLNDRYLRPLGRGTSQLLSNVSARNGCEQAQVQPVKEFDVLLPAGSPTGASASRDARFVGDREFGTPRRAAAGSETKKTVRESRSLTRSTSFFSKTTQRIFNRSEWSKATSVDTAHAADLVFNIEIGNEGTDVARQITAIIVNIFLGDSQEVIHTANLLGTTATVNRLENLFPGSGLRIASTQEVPLSLDEIRRFDLGEPFRISVVRIEYGDDQLFYENAYAGGVMFQVDDGVDDNTEDVKPFLIPTWGEESYLDVLGRVQDVLKLTFDANRALRWVDVPQFDSQHRLAGFERLANQDNARWLVFTQTADDAPFSQKVARPETAVLFKYLKDEDRDGFADSEEFQRGTNPRDAADFPKPILRAGFVEETIGNQTFTSLVVTNAGNYAATGVEAVAYSPDGSHDLTKNFTGGGGVIEPSQQVVIGPRYVGPDLSGWTGSALPVIQGIYTGPKDIRFTFAVLDSGNVGQPNVPLRVQVRWDTSEVVLNLGNGYRSPSPLPVTGGFAVGFASGFLKAGEVFSVEARATGDSFARLAGVGSTNSPSVVLSYNSPRGNHRMAVTEKLVSRTNVPTVAANSSLGTSLVVSAFSTMRLDETNWIHCQVLCVDRVMTNARVFHELIDPEGLTTNVVWSSTQAKSATFGINHVNVPFKPATQARNPLVEGKVYYLLSTLTDALTEDAEGTERGGNVVDQTMQAVTFFNAAALEALPQPKLNISFDPPSTTNLMSGEVATWRITLANTGAAPLEALLALDRFGLASSALGDKVTLVPGASQSITVRFDGNSLAGAAGPFSFPVFSNDPKRPSYPVTAQIHLNSGIASATQVISPEGAPWRREVILKGPATNGTVVVVDFGRTWNVTGFEPYFVTDDRGTLLGRGPRYRADDSALPQLLSNSALRPSRIFFTLPADIPEHQMVRFRLECGLVRRIAGGFASIPLPLPNNSIQSISVANIALSSKLGDPLFQGRGSGGGQTGSYSEGRINVSRTALAISTFMTAEPGRTHSAACNLLMNHDLRRLGIETIEAIAEVDGTGAKIGISPSGPWFPVPSGTNRLRMQFNWADNAISVSVGSGAEATATFNPFGSVLLELHTFVKQSESRATAAVLRSLEVDGSEIISTSSTYPEMKGHGQRSRGEPWNFQLANAGVKSLSVNVGESSAIGVGSISLTTPWSASGFSMASIDGADVLGLGAATVERSRDVPGDGVLSWNTEAVVQKPASFVGNWSIAPSFKSFQSSQEDVNVGRESTLWSLESVKSSADGVSVVQIESPGSDGIVVGLSRLEYVSVGSRGDLIVPKLAASPSVGVSKSQSVKFEATVSNVGPAAVRGFTVGVFEGASLANARWLASAFVTNEIPAAQSTNGSSLVVTIPWEADASPGPATVFAVVDYGDAITESDERNNQSPLVSMGFAFERSFSVDSGTVNDRGYSPGTYGYENGEAFAWAANPTPLQTVRYSANGELIYRFDGLSADYAYAVDLAFHRPGNVPLRYQVFADDALLETFVANTETASKGTGVVELNQNGRGNTVFATAYLPARVLADGSARIRIREVDGKPVSLSSISLARGDRVFIDCGRAGTLLTGQPADPRFGAFTNAAGIRYGYLDEAPGTATLPAATGSGSAESWRFAPLGRLAYRLSGLGNQKFYLIRPTLLGRPGKHHRVLANGSPIALLGLNDRLPVTFTLPPVRLAGTDLTIVVENTDPAGTRLDGDASLVDLEIAEFGGAVAALADSDRDSLPDWWELQYAASGATLVAAADASADFDSDGVPNADEFVAGTDPSNSGSKLSLQVQLAPDGSSIRVSWPTAPGRLYTLESTDSVDTESVPLVLNVQASQAGVRQVNLPIDSANRFLRVRVALANPL